MSTQVTQANHSSWYQDESAYPGDSIYCEVSSEPGTQWRPVVHRCDHEEIRQGSLFREGFYVPGGDSFGRISPTVNGTMNFMGCD